ncbi:MAG: DUF4249 family protein [Bacteroidota bacterium]
MREKIIIKSKMVEGENYSLFHKLPSFIYGLFRFNILIIIISVTIMVSCTEKMDIDLGTTYTRLVVAGNITPQIGEQYIRLTKSADYFSNEPPPNVSGAIVKVDNGELSVEFTEDSLNLGYYIAPDGYVGAQGSTYNLSITLADPINGTVNYEANETMPQLADNIDSIVLEQSPNGKRWMVRLYAWEPPTTDFYMFNGMVNGVMLTDSVSRVNISDDRLYNGNYTAGAIVLILYEDEVKPGDTFTLILSNITEEYANFQLELKDEIGPNDPMFSGPPANVSSNVNNDAVGYFAAFPSAFTSTIVVDIED